MNRQNKMTNQKMTRTSLLKSKTIIWANILLQFLSPIVLTFSAGQTANAVQQTREYSQQEQQVANVSQQLGRIAASKNSAQAAIDTSRNLITQNANNAIDQWLKQFGTARVQLNTNNRLSLEGSQLDLLLPLLDSQRALTFSQWGIRRLDSRTITNFGIGQRLFADDYAIGGNIFFDHDFTYNHSRLGLGSEYWLNNIKLAANGYLALTDWRSDTALVDYQAKPANGFDLRADAYLPSYPQLGGKLAYEQYFGSNVALFGKDKLQQDPYALTLGVNYTPIPLVTIGVDQKQGQSGSHETRLNLGLTYRFGQTLQQQLDASQIAQQRSLAGSHYDLIERNNDIVLQYRKQQVIHLTLPTHLQGKTGEIISLSATVNHKYPLKTIEWQSNDTAIQQGIQQQGEQWFITLPAYNTNGTNSYNLTGTAYDVNGNASEPVSLLLRAEIDR